ncbi:MAG: hypothetical protein J7M14_04890 [Planctomycetes bacterium]|nr:hypothetical protein [Planctomycetota bacterium]
MLLMLSRRLHEAYRFQVTGRWKRPAEEAEVLAGGLLIFPAGKAAPGPSAALTYAPQTC